MTPRLPFVLTIIISIVIALVIWRLDSGVVLSSGERFINNVVWTFQRDAPPPETAPVAVVSITDKTLDRFAARTPVDRQFLADLINRIAKDHPKAIGLDVLLDRPTQPEKDKVLAALLANPPVPMAVGYMLPSDETPEYARFQDDMVPPALRATTYIHGIAGIPQLIDPGYGTGAGRIAQLPYKLAAMAGANPPNQGLLVRYPHLAPGGWPIPVFPAEVVDVLPEQFLKDKIVLIGGDILNTDQWRTPYAAAFADRPARMPGVMVQALVVKQLLNHDLGPLDVPLATCLVILAGALLGGMTMPDLPPTTSVVLRAVALISFTYVLIWRVAVTGMPLPVVGMLVAFVLANWWRNASLAWLAAKSNRESPSRLT
ncbi:MAG TPA: CHASE2 domain-containing protein [Stellaceae bacterium]|jgi:CHASE2 domain-containing sensor protein|nr:CHASE2 domain-containing protein [Stellaceae bacterium]